MAKVLIRPAVQDDSEHWERMRQDLWPTSKGEHATEIAAFFDGNRNNPAEVLKAFRKTGVGPS